MTEPWHVAWPATAPEALPLTPVPRRIDGHAAMGGATYAKTLSRDNRWNQWIYVRAADAVWVSMGGSAPSNDARSQVVAPPGQWLQLPARTDLYTRRVGSADVSGSLEVFRSPLVIDTVPMGPSGFFHRAKPGFDLDSFVTPAGVTMRMLALIRTGTRSGNEIFDVNDNRGMLVDGDNRLEDVDGAGGGITVGRMQVNSPGSRIWLNRTGSGDADFSDGFGGETGETYAGQPCTSNS